MAVCGMWGLRLVHSAEEFLADDIVLALRGFWFCYRDDCDGLFKESARSDSVGREIIHSGMLCMT